MPDLIDGYPNPVDSPLPDQVTEAIAVGGVNSVAGQPSSLANLSFGNAAANINLTQQNAAANQQALNNLGLSVVGAAVNMVADLDPLEAMSAEQVLTGNVVAQEIIDIQGALSLLGNKKSAPASAKLPVLRRGKSGRYKLLIRSDQMPFEAVIFRPGEPVKPDSSGEPEGFK